MINVNTTTKPTNTSHLKFSVSGREISPDDDVIYKINSYFPGIKISDVFAFTTDFTPLYGGRKHDYFLSYQQIDKIYAQGWSFSLPISNLFFSNDAYKKTIPILKKIYKPGNSVIVSNSKLAKAVRNDFPDFTIKASCIANIGFNEDSVLQEIEEGFKYYDLITLHQKTWNKESILTRIKEKERIVLFADTSCAPDCENQACYWNSSFINFFKQPKGIKNEIPFRHCAKMQNKIRQQWRTINFQKALPSMYNGYIHFKYGKRRNFGALKKRLTEQGHPGYN